MADLLGSLFIAVLVVAWTFLATVDWIHPGNPDPERTTQ